MLKLQWIEKLPLSREDWYLCVCGVAGLVMLIVIVSILPARALGLLGSSSAASTEGLSGFEVPFGEEDSKGLYRFGQSLVTIGEHGAFVRFDMTLEYDKVELHLASKRERGSGDAESFFESKRAKISDVLVTEMSRLRSTEAYGGKALSSLQDELMAALNDSLRARGELVSGVYFTSFLLVPPES